MPTVSEPAKPDKLPTSNDGECPARREIDPLPPTVDVIVAGIGFGAYLDRRSILRAVQETTAMVRISTQFTVVVNFITANWYKSLTAVKDAG